MNKLKLQVEELAVDSFETGRTGEPARGTVQANEDQPTVKYVCDWTLLGTNPTCCPCTPAY